MADAKDAKVKQCMFEYECKDCGETWWTNPKEANYACPKCGKHGMRTMTPWKFQ